MNQNINIDLQEIENVKCEECGEQFFTPVFVIKHISALMSPNGQETLMPIQVFKCEKCNHINEMFSEVMTN
jgi:ribosomal protein S27E